jgi:three-Cys-motif partner protein
MSDEELYSGREQTQVKHFILREYLRRFAHIIGFRWNVITYIDCFSGPWESRSGELADTSFSIALHELKRAQESHSSRGKTLQLRCMFLEKDPEAFVKLAAFAAGITEVVVETRNQSLADAVPEILRFVALGGKDSFPFFFIDPTGWTGFGMKQIAPILREQPGEVLINFMTDFIRRFIYHPDQQTGEQFADLFGAEDIKVRIQQLPDAQDREEALFQAYAANVKRTGRFPYTCAATILYPQIDRSFFHLIYATRNRKGVEVFKHAEKRGMAVMAQARARAKQRKRQETTGQGELFAAEEMPISQPIDQIRARQLDRTKQLVRDSLSSGHLVPYEQVWDLALSFPLVWESDLKNWINSWKEQGLLQIDGMKPRQRVPKLDEHNVLRWQERGDEKSKGP